MRTVTKNGKKTTKSKVLSCKVLVKQAAPDTKVPDTSETMNEDVTVSNQAQLENALKNAETRTLCLQTDTSDTFTIPKADYKDIALTVDAPNADVVNNGTFQSISVLAIKDSTWLENAAGNIFNVFAKAARFVVQPGADVNSITFSQAGAKVLLEANGNVNDVSFAAPDTDAKVSVAQGGTVSNLSVTEDAQRTKVDVDIDGSIGNMQLAAPDADIKAAVAEGGAVSNVAMDAAADSAKVSLDVKGTVSDVSLDAQNADVSLAVNDNGKAGNVAVSKEMNLAISGTAKEVIAVKVSASAKITASIGIALESSADISLVLEKGAEGSSVKITGNLAAVKVKVENKTGQNMPVNTPNGSYTVFKGSNRDITVNAPSASGASSSSGSSWSGGFSFGGSWSGGSSSGGSSSGGSSSDDSGSTGDQTSGTLKGIVLDHTDFTMKRGQEETIRVSVEPEASGRLENIEWAYDSQQIITYSDTESMRTDTVKVKAYNIGTTVISVTADIYGPEKDSALIQPNQTKTIIVTVTEDGNAPPEPAVKLTLTADPSSISIGNTATITAELTDGATINYPLWKICGRPIIEAPYVAGLSNHACMVRGEKIGTGTVTLIASVTLADGTQTTVTETVEVEVTDNTDPENVPFIMRLSNKDILTPLTKGDEYQLGVEAPDAYELKITKIHWTSSDNEVVQIKPDSNTAEITVENETLPIRALKIGNSTLTAVITYTVGSETFEKTISEDFTVLRAMTDIKIKAEIVTGSALTSLIAPNANCPEWGIHISLSYTPTPEDTPVLNPNDEPITFYGGLHDRLHLSMVLYNMTGVFLLRYEEDITKDLVEYKVPINMPFGINTLYANLNIKITDSWRNVEVTCDDLSWGSPASAQNS